MKQNLRHPFRIGLTGAIVTLLFGNWSIIILSVIVGAMVGLRREEENGRYSTPHDAGKAALKPGLVAAAGVLLGGILYAFVVLPLTGKRILYLVPIASTQLDSLSTLAINALVGLVAGAGAAWFVASRQAMPAAQRQRQMLLALAAFLVFFPFYVQVTRLGWMAAAITIQIYILLALGLNVVVGYAGLLDLGYAAFFAIGAYTTALLSSPQVQFHWNFWLLIWIAAAVAAVAGIILGSPTLPLRGDYLAIVTLGFGEIVPVVFRNLIQVTLREPLTGWCLVGCDPAIELKNACVYACTGPLNLTAGEKGINPIGRPLIPFLPNDFFGSQSYIPWYFLVLVLIIFSILMIRRLHQSRIGRAWMAIREDELAASQMGIDPVKTKLLAFAIGATFSGFAGAFYATYIGAIFPGVFDFSVSVIILCMVILGGLGNMTGVMIGTVLIMGTDRLFLPRIAELLKGFLNTTVLPAISNPEWKDFLGTSLDPVQWRLGLFGLILVIMMVVRPEGLIPSTQRRAELHEEEEADDPALRMAETAVQGGSK